MCISKAKEENFLEYAGAVAAGASSSTMTGMIGQSRRIAILPHVPEHVVSKHLLERGDFRLHSLSYFVENGTCTMTKQIGISIFKSFRLLRVLNIENAPQVCGYMPIEIGNLIHLKYLGLRATELRHAALPASISNLRSLCTLDLRDNDVMWLPDEVCKFESLRHLLISRDVLIRLDSLTNLETLKVVNAKSLIEKDAVIRMTNLRSLSTRFYRKEECEVLLNYPSFALSHLRSLEMRISAFPNLEALSRCRDLTKAVLNGSLHHSLKFIPSSLTKLRFGRSNLEQDPMVILEKLHNLRFLSLEINAYVGRTIVCSTNGFPKLEILRLKCLFKLEEWRTEEGAMPLLKTLHLEGLDKLEMIPEGLKYITTLQELNLVKMSYDFVERVKTRNGVKGEDFDKVKLIPSI